MNIINKILLKALNRPPELRKGQAIYNYAYELFPDMVKKMGNKYDCFYLDEKIEIFLEELERRLEKNNMLHE